MVATDERELTATERGYMLRAYLEERPRKTDEVRRLLGYRSYSAAASLLYRLRVAGLVRDDAGYWYLVTQCA